MPEIHDNREESVQDIRRAMGTLPSEAPELKTSFCTLEESLRVRLASSPGNPYTAIFDSSCATWGDDSYDPKWPKVTPPNRFKVCLAALTGNTLPQAMEVVSFLFHVRGTPRWLFEEHARDMPQFTTYLSVGCRDNNKLDASIVTPSAVDQGYFHTAKQNYQSIIDDGQESWQSARTVLPMSYHHPYYFYTSLLSLMMNYRRFQKTQEERPEIALLLDRCVTAVGSAYPLIERCVREKTLEESIWSSLDPRDYVFFSKE